MGPLNSDVTEAEEEGVLKISDKKWLTGEEVYTNSDITKKKNMYKILFFACFGSVQQQLSFG